MENIQMELSQGVDPLEKSIGRLSPHSGGCKRNIGLIKSRSSARNTGYLQRTYPLMHIKVRIKIDKKITMTEIITTGTMRTIIMIWKLKAEACIKSTFFTCLG